MRFTAVAMLAGALFILASPRAARAQEVPGQPAPLVLGLGDPTFDPNQPIKAQFVVSVTVTSAGGQPEPDLTGVFVVDPTGAIQMKMIGRVELRGLTPLQASDKIAALLKPYIRDPKAQVAIVSVPKPVIFLSGSINAPGQANINEGTTLAEVLTLIGFDVNADLSRIRIVHRDGANRSVREFDFTRWLKPNPGQKPDESQNPTLADRDLIYVPPRTLPGTGQVSVEGEVARPGIVPIRLGVSTQLREVLSLAGGPLPTADLHQVSVRRVGVERAMTVEYDKMEQGDPVHNLEVRPDDIVYVAKLNYDRFINLNGAFVRPGRLPFQRDITLTQVISEAGGITNGAKESDGRVFRHIGPADPTRTQIIAFDYKKIRTNRQPDILLQPGDTVEIPQGTPKLPMDPLQTVASLLSIALIVDRLFSGGAGAGHGLLF